MGKEAEENSDGTNIQGIKSRAEKRKQIIDSCLFVIPGGRGIEEIEDYIRELREDRF